MSNKSVDEQMEAAAYEPTESKLDDGGKPTNPIFDLEEMLKSEPRYVWWDIEYEGEIQAIQVMKGEVIHFYGTLDDAELLIIAPLYDQTAEPEPTEDDAEDTPPEDRNFIESVEYTRQLKLHNDFILRTFIKGVTKENLEQIPDELKRQMLKAYDGVNGISITNKAVRRFPPKSGE